MSRGIDLRGIPSSGLAWVGKIGLVFPLVYLPRNSRGEDSSPTYTEEIKMQKYLGKKLLPPH